MKRIQIEQINLHLQTPKLVNPRLQNLIHLPPKPIRHPPHRPLHQPRLRIRHENRTFRLEQLRDHGRPIVRRPLALEDGREEEEDVGVRIEGLENFLVVEDLEFLGVRFDGEFTAGVFAPGDAARGVFWVEGFGVGMRLEGCGVDDSFGTDKVEEDWDAVEAVAELFPKVAWEGGFSAGAEDEYSGCGRVDVGFSKPVDSLRGRVEGVGSEG